MPEDQRFAPPILGVVDERRQTSLGVGERGLPHANKMTTSALSSNLPRLSAKRALLVAWTSTPRARRGRRLRSSRLRPGCYRIDWLERRCSQPPRESFRRSLARSLAASRRGSTGSRRPSSRRAVDEMNLEQLPKRRTPTPLIVRERSFTSLAGSAPFRVVPRQAPRDGLGLARRERPGGFIMGSNHRHRTIPWQNYRTTDPQTARVPAIRRSTSTESATWAKRA